LILRQNLAYLPYFFFGRLWIALGKRQIVSEKGRDNSEKGRIKIVLKTPKTRMNKSFAACPRARARKTRKNYIKTQKSFLKTVDNFKSPELKKMVKKKQYADKSDLTTLSALERLLKRTQIDLNQKHIPK
jgi:hypothetical protein